MEYRAVGNRCAVNLDSLLLPVSRNEAICVLGKKGFRIVQVDIVLLARQCVGASRYRRGARLFEAPAVVDCSSFVKWLYAQRGIWLPRRSVQQRELGEEVALAEIVPGDLVFASGRIDYYRDNPQDGVGHVGIATGDKTVIHAANSREHVIENPLAAFAEEKKFRGVRRYIANGADVLTLETPAGREVEVADDIRWIILQTLSKPKNP